MTVFRQRHLKSGQPVSIRSCRSAWRDAGREAVVGGAGLCCPSSRVASQQKLVHPKRRASNQGPYRKFSYAALPRTRPAPNPDGACRPVHRHAPIDGPRDQCVCCLRIGRNGATSSHETAFCPPTASFSSLDGELHRPGDRRKRSDQRFVNRDQAASCSSAARRPQRQRRCS